MKKMKMRSYSFQDFILYFSRVLVISPLHPNISLQVLHTFLHTFPNVLMRRICLTIKSLFD